MRALFVGGVIDNNEVDMDGTEPPRHYPPETGSGQSRYRLHAVGRRDGVVLCAVYGAPGLERAQVLRVSDERGHARRFDTVLEEVD
ncbi:hypothetical protein [Luteimonas wenzhouensis]|jgi:hypothetical protein|uniref:Uncharacterized protein n=1 Tax=Luteimonas wenzhouensis TaxID=2599615 RepID=A0A5C5U0V6_9GAMM|nr:hypothetical protein [Luteimonas wenzhouensis]NLW96793.1 hypothetical protein [Xanthomonadaceae bacterium]TWT19546.1 hypothetical protein FQY79_06770 [Luteimonas wenzhouensis]